MAALEEKRWESLSHVQDQTWRAGLRPAGTWGELEMGEGSIHDWGSLTQGRTEMQADGRLWNFWAGHDSLRAP